MKRPEKASASPLRASRFCSICFSHPRSKLVVGQVHVKSEEFARVGGIVGILQLISSVQFGSMATRCNLTNLAPIKF